MCIRDRYRTFSRAGDIFFQLIYYLILIRVISVSYTHLVIGTTRSLNFNNQDALNLEIIDWKLEHGMVPVSYTHLLENQIRKSFGFEGTPIRFIIRERNE